MKSESEHPLSNAPNHGRKFICESLEDTKKAAEYFANLSHTRPGVCLALYGTLGSGKTTFSQFFIKTLIPSIKEVSSPTFTIAQIYEGISSSGDSGANSAPRHLEIWHVDCYRLKDPEEFYELGLEETLGNRISIIEWPKIIEDFLPTNTIKLQFEMLKENKRLIYQK